MVDKINRAISALHALDPSTSREEWVRIAMTAKAAGITMEEFTEWSRLAQNFQSERDCQTVWKSIKDGPVTESTLFGMARAAGWQDESTTRPVRSSPSAITPAMLWQQCTEATAEHPYIVAKRGHADGLRVVPKENATTIAGNAVAGWLVVPATSLDGALRTLQLIPPPGTGKKLNMPGASFDDGIFIIGDIAESARVFIVEGIGQGWACWSATGHAAVVCFGAGRMSTAAAMLRKRFSILALVVVSDRGKELQAEAIAKHVSGSWVAMPESAPTNYDANDYAAEHGADALAELLDTAKAPQRRFRILSTKEVLDMPPPRWLVRGVLPAEGLACIFGASSSGKSFLALDLCAAIAAGVRWFSSRVTAAPVVYAALEGEAGFRQRVKAWQVHHGHEMPDKLRFILQGFDLRKPEDVDTLAQDVIASGHAGGLLVIDTLNRAASGADENTSADMGRIIDAAKTLQNRLGGLVLLIHHSGKDASRGLRGHSSLNAALDASIEVVRIENRREWRIDKAKDNADDAGVSFQLQVVEIGRDDEGEPITSCVVVADDAPQSMRRTLPPKSGNQKIAWDTVRERLKNIGTAPPEGAPTSLPKGAPAISIEAAIESVRERLTCDLKRRTERARQALDGIHSRGLVRIERGFVWMT